MKLKSIPFAFAFRQLPGNKSGGFFAYKATASWGVERKAFTVKCVLSLRRPRVLDFFLPFAEGYWAPALGKKKGGWGSRFHGVLWKGFCLFGSFCVPIGSP
ncbi:hypothetical protein TRVL_02614 [Trypanosoma vivax]|nr:hypothetical protein TRVL_02614 [Trypanosoma vivax]